MENGFRIVTILRDYIRDEVTNGDSALIVWDNPDYKPTWNNSVLGIRRRATRGRHWKWTRFIETNDRGTDDRGIETRSWLSWHPTGSIAASFSSESGPAGSWCWAVRRCLPPAEATRPPEPEKAMRCSSTTGSNTSMSMTRESPPRWPGSKPRPESMRPIPRASTPTRTGSGSISRNWPLDNRRA